MANEVSECPICLRAIAPGKGSDYGERVSITCMCCGKFTYTGTVAGMLALRNKNGEIDLYKRAAIMHRIRKASSNSPFELNSSVLKLWLAESTTVPSPVEQIDNLLTWLANNLRAAGQRVDLTFDTHQAIVGAADKFGFGWVLHEANAFNWLHGAYKQFPDGSGQMGNATLTLAGWQRAAEIERSASRSRLAFIAMQFGDKELEAFVRDHLKPAVKATGFELRALNEEQPAGLIDDQLRVAIRRARFVLVELSHANRGAYWEAGFAEGLGKPVIYLCRAEVFNASDGPNKPHFDTNHLVTIIWDPADLAGAAKRLAACIRATLPEDAKMADVD